MAREEMVCAVPACPRSTPNHPICGVCRRFLDEAQNDALYAAFRGVRHNEKLDEGGESGKRLRAYNDALAVAVRVVIEGQMKLDEEKWAA